MADLSLKTSLLTYVSFQKNHKAKFATEKQIELQSMLKYINNGLNPKSECRTEYSIHHSKQKNYIAHLSISSTSGEMLYNCKLMDEISLDVSVALKKHINTTSNTCSYSTSTLTANIRYSSENLKWTKANEPCSFPI